MMMMNNDHRRIIVLAPNDVARTEHESSSSSSFSCNDDHDGVFGSHLCGMFEDPGASKTDACALFCCGICLWQRNHDVWIRGNGLDAGGENSSSSSSTIPKSTNILLRRPFESAFVVLLATTIVVWSLDDPTTTTTTITDLNALPIVVAVDCWVLLVSLIWKFFQFQRSRKIFRKQLAVTEYHRRKRLETTTEEYDALKDPTDQELAALFGHDKREIYGDGAHDLCGWARSDARWVGNTIQRRRRRWQHETDPGDDAEIMDEGFCRRAWGFLASLCCGCLCGCHLQLCGMCAIAQESRYLQRIFRCTPSSETSSSSTSTTGNSWLWQRDYITLQPWSEYYPSILRLRVSNQIHWFPHCKALSTLSRRILVSAVALLLFVTLLILLPVRFPKWEIIILYGTFLQPVIFLFFVHWLWNRLDLSFDAVVKYFACGFFICTSSALVYEWVVAKAAQKLLLLVDHIGSKGLEMYYQEHDNTDDALSGHPLIIGGQQHYSNGVKGGSRGYEFEEPLWYLLIIASLTAFVNAFFVAALTEELCKYLCFWMVEHPDLELRHKILLSSKSPSRSHKKNEMNGDDDDDTEATGLLASRKDTTVLSDPEEQSVAVAPMASLVSIGEAITVAMITVSLGFACAENILYIFIYTPQGWDAEIGTLYVRCLFPIHPMAAALQSIGVCSRDLEKNSTIGIGKILFPAWLLHGCFDASLMAYSAIRKILDRHNLMNDYSRIPSATHPPEIEPGGSETVDADEGIPFLIYVMAIPFFAMMYFLNESFYQRERLERLDKENRPSETS